MPIKRKDDPKQYSFPYAGRHLLIVALEKKTTCLLYDLIDYNTATIDDFIHRLKPHLTSHIRSDDFIRDWGSHKRLSHTMCGACVPATQAIFYAFDTNVLVPHRALDNDGMMHWWCKDKITGDVIDATASQYTDDRVIPPYKDGSKSNWYGWKGNAQIRSLRLLNRVMSDSQLYEVEGNDYSPPGILPV